MCALILVSGFFALPRTSFAACTADKYEELKYPGILNAVKDTYYDSDKGKNVSIHADYLKKDADGKYVYVGKVLDPRPDDAPQNAGLIWIPKEACGKKVDLLIALHGWRSLSKPGVNIFLKDPGQKQFDKIIREELDKKTIEPIVVAAPMYDRGPNQTVWEEGHYNVNTLITEIKKKLSGLNIEFSRVSIIGHSNANCGGGLARSAKLLTGYPLYIYGAADGTCGNQEKSDFFQKYDVLNTVKNKKAILFHMSQNTADTEASAYLKGQGGGLDTEAKYTSQYKEAWKNSDGTIFTYRLTGGGDHNHTTVPQYMLKELLPRFFSSKPYNPAESKKPVTVAPGNNPAESADLFGFLGKAWDGKPLTDEEVQKMLTKPNPKIKIPGLAFSDQTLAEVTDANGNKQIYISVPFLGEYIGAIFRYGVIFMSILCVLIIIISGMQYILRGSGEGKEEVMHRIQGSLVGLIIAVSSYAILYAINPMLVEFENLHVLFVQPQSGQAEHTAAAEAAAGAGVVPPPCVGKKPPSELVFGNADFARSEPYSCGNRDLSTVKWLVIHEGAVGDTTGVLTARGLSTHFVIERDGIVKQNVDIRRRAAHAGSLINAWSVGIDLQIPKGCNQSGKCVNNLECSTKCSYTPDQYEALNQLINVLTQKTAIRKNDQQIIGHCQIKYPTSAGHGDPRNFDWTKIGLDPDKHRKNKNYINGRCIKTYTVDIFEKEKAKTPKPKAVGAVGCCQITENEQPKFINEAENQCAARKNVIIWLPESCPQPANAT